MNGETLSPHAALHFLQSSAASPDLEVSVLQGGFAQFARLYHTETNVFSDWDDELWQRIWAAQASESAAPGPGPAHTPTPPPQVAKSEAPSGRPLKAQPPSTGQGIAPTPPATPPPRREGAAAPNAEPAQRPQSPIRRETPVSAAVVCAQGSA